MATALPDGWHLWWRTEEAPRERWLARREGSRGWFDARVVPREGPHADLLWDEDVAFLANVCRRAPHPFLPRVVTTLTTDEAHLVVTDHVPGADLAALLAAARRGGRRMPPAQAASIVAAAAAGVEHLRREAGFVLGHLDPASIRARPEGGAVLRDPWRLARPLPMGVTGRTSFVPTLRYIAPELVRGLTPDPRADVYSLGVALYEAVTGAVAYDAASDLDRIRAILDGPPLAPPRALAPELPPAFEAVVVRATAKRADDRYATPGELARALAPWCEPGAVGAAAPYRGATAAAVEPDTARVDRAVAAMLAGPATSADAWWGAIGGELLDAARRGRLDDGVVVALTELRDAAGATLRELLDAPSTAHEARPLLRRLLTGGPDDRPRPPRRVYVGAVQVDACARSWEALLPAAGSPDVRYCDACGHTVTRAEGADVFALAAGRRCARHGPE